MISNFSKTQVILIKDYSEIEKYFKKNLMDDEIIIGMSWINFQIYARTKDLSMRSNI